MSEVAIINKSSLPDADIAFAAAACDIQLRDHFLPLWPGIEYTPVRFYSTERNLPVVSDLARLMVVSDTIDWPGIAGIHLMDPLIRGVVLNQGAQTSVTLSHEVLEMAADPTCTIWVDMPDGRRVAYENCDPCQGDEYAIEVEIFGARRSVRVSNFVTPRWFGHVSTGPLDYAGLMVAPFEIRPGGYIVVRDKNGRVSDEWGARPNVLARARKAWNSTSRSHRRGMR